MKHCNLEEFAGGALSVQFNKALRQVAENITDPNTDPKKARKILVTVTLKPNDQRNFIATGVETKVALAPELGAVTALSMGRDLESGEVDCVEIGNQIPGQLSFADYEKQTEPEPVRGYDPSTGEIYEMTPEPIDLRRAK